MNFLKDIKSYCAVLSVAGMLCSCASAVFPEVQENEEDNSLYSKRIDENGNITTKAGKKIEMTMPEESDTLAADKKNVAYEDDPELEDAMNPDIIKKADEEKKVEKVEKAAVVPVLVKEKDVSGKEVSENSVASASDEFSSPKDEEKDNAPSITYQLDTFYFANGSAVLDSKYNGKIREIVKIAKANNGKIKVLGFASSRTRNTDIASHKLANFKVSAERAQAVAAALKRAGLPSDQLETEALSDSVPAYLEVMPEGERLNRRAEVYISY